MRLSALIAILMAGVTSMFATNDFSSENTRCRELAEASVSVAADARAALDLVNGLWTDDSQTTYVFSKNGSLILFSKNGKGETRANLSDWKVDMLDDVPVLFIYGKSTGAELFHIEQTCQGIDLTNLANHDLISLDYKTIPRSGHANKVEKNLPGDWTSVTLIESEKKCESVRGAYLNYSFGENGRYRIDYGSQATQELEEGKWSVSKDGQFLLLTDSFGNVSVIRIAQVDSHGLILEQVMASNEISEYFCSEQTSFAFIK